MRRLFLAVLVLWAAPVMADEKIWSALVLASNPAPGSRPEEAPEDLAPYVKRLTKVFGYEQFEILGSASKLMGGSQQERWLVPSPTFLVGAQARPEGSGYRIQLELFQDKRRILQTEAKLGMQSPLFIGGPRHARGQLIVVFEIRP